MNVAFTCHAGYSPSSSRILYVLLVLIPLEDRLQIEDPGGGIPVGRKMNLLSSLVVYRKPRHSASPKRQRDSHIIM